MTFQKSMIDLPQTDISRIGDVVLDFLNQCGIRYPHGAILDEPYRAACYAVAEQRGYDLGEHLDVGVYIGAGFLHLNSLSASIYVAMFSAFLAKIDDNYGTYADGIREFLDRFAHRQPQKYKLFNDFVDLLDETPQHWGVIASNLIIASAVDFVTSMMIENKIEGMEIQLGKAPQFPRFTRNLSGCSRAYAVMTFPPHLDLRSWIQVVPDLVHYIDHANDVLSYFKEELSGETVNYVSLSARSRGLTKIEALKNLADETAQTYRRGMDLLQHCPDALEAYKAFGVGYVRFHKLSLRYKLDQLRLQ